MDHSYWQPKWALAEPKLSEGTETLAGSAPRKSRRCGGTRTSVRAAVADAGVVRVVIVGEHVADDLLDAGAQDLEPLAHQHLRRRARGVGGVGLGVGERAGGRRARP